MMMRWYPHLFSFAKWIESIYGIGVSFTEIQPHKFVEEASGRELKWGMPFAPPVFRSPALKMYKLKYALQERWNGAYLQKRTSFHSIVI